MSDPSESAEGRGTKNVFLSASFPRRERNLTFFQTADPEEITQAIVALTQEVFVNRGQLVFGAHPSVSPLVLSTASYIQKSEQKTGRENPAKLPVIAYQSRAFEGFHQSTAFADCLDCVWTRADGETPKFTPSHVLVHNSVRKSLKIMRESMLSKADPVAGVFIGGMEGILEEAEIFLQLFPDRPAFFIGAPGGASLECAHRYDSPGSQPPVSHSELLKARNYRGLMKKIVAGVFN